MYRNIGSPFQATGVLIRHRKAILTGDGSFFVEKNINGQAGWSQTVAILPSLFFPEFPCKFRRQADFPPKPDKNWI
ncbi:hypothetical protein [Xenorhabdus cabanillasii]|uniref:hypothetical protein n=1 Tax=Xenorhabdus cabanillasii TaxID=351673 RepID=UPI000E263310|nr:hypothetical protein [Xenorhabdus cabanillasii]